MAHAKDLLWASGRDESVEVNQRALIDKVLARYSGEFTVFRELLQNSDDAQSKAVEIRFETQGFVDQRAGRETTDVSASGGTLPDLKTELVCQWTFKNNGMVFRDEDWSRLKKIAEGNPDEEKIGAFGVGFYSLFSVTEEPFVTSGGQWMGFYWKDKKDQLFVRRGDLPATDTPDPWTSFEMTLREPAPIPVAFDFTRFLASSITFMTHLSEVALYFDDKQLARLTKDSGVPRSLSIPRGLQSTSRLGMMQVKGVQSTPLHIKAEVMRWVYAGGSEKPPPPSVVKATKPAPQSGFFSSLFSIALGATPQRPTIALPAAIPEEKVDLQAVTETRVTLSIFSADVEVRLDKKLTTELVRSTKKNPPKRLKYDLIYTAKDEYDASLKEDEKLTFATGSVFQGLRADLDGTGSARVFIGHATAQTTGIGGHMATRFIPTVERESIDLVDRNVAVWNRELLYVGGFLARTAYELELANIQDLWKGASGNAASLPDPELRLWLHNRALHALKFFSFHQSTPSADVSSLLEAAFFSCGSSHPFSIMSTVGVRSISDIRLPDPVFSGFLKQLPMLPDTLLTEAKVMVDALKNRNMMGPITFEDILNELRSRPLPEDEMVSCLKWWIGIYKQGNNDNLHRIRTELLNAAVLTIGHSGTANERIIPLATIKTFINSKNIGGHIPLDGPLPLDLLPFTVSNNFPAEALLSSLPWFELSIPSWLRYITSPGVGSVDPAHDMTLSAVWAERVLTVLARSWPSLSGQMKTEVVSLLHDKACIPTSGGLKTPEQSYFANANVFHDLPTIVFPSGLAVKGPIEKLLQALGVRKHVDLQVVFNRMMKTGDWTIAELTKYLVAVQSTLTPEEWTRLKMTAAFAKEGSPPDANGQKPTRYKAKDLYEPLENFRQLKLPVIDWGTETKWRSKSSEASFLFELGLIRFPPLDVIVGLCAHEDAKVRMTALGYLLDNMTSRYPDYEPMNFADVAFLPAIKGGKPQMGTPKEVFSNPDWANLGFLVLSPATINQHDVGIKLKVKKHPPTSSLVSLLEKTPPKDEVQASQWFGLLAGRISDFSSSELKRLSELPMIPVKTTPAQEKAKGTGPLRWLPPKQCFFGGDARAQFHSRLFVFIDFGVSANGFLSACGTKHEPSVEEVVQILLADPHKFFALADGRENYLAELRNIAVNNRLLSSMTIARMKRAAILLASRRQARSSAKKLVTSPDLDEDDWDLQYDLKCPDEIVIADDTNAYQLFGDSLFCAPQEDILETFYVLLGSRRLSSLVKEIYQTSTEIRDAKLSADIRALILERLPLFLHEHSHGSSTRVKAEWLNSESNFVVKTYGKLTVTKNLNFGDLRLSRTQDASAAAKQTGHGPIQLWLAGNAQIDMYEVSTSLCRLLFSSPKANDALLFMTILQSDLKSLKRRGYNVDRILRRQKAAREAAEEARARAESTQLLSSSRPTSPPIPKGFSETRAVSPPPSSISTDTLVPRSTSPTPSTASSTRSGPFANSRPVSMVKNVLQNLKRKPEQDQAALPPIPTGEAPSVPQHSRPNNQTVTPLSNISSNIDMAIKACRPEAGGLLRNREQMQQVKESLNEGYCDISGRTDDLDLVGEMGNVKVYVSRAVPEGQTIMTSKHDAIARFIHVITPLDPPWT